MALLARENLAPVLCVYFFEGELDVGLRPSLMLATAIK